MYPIRKEIFKKSCFSKKLRSAKINTILFSIMLFITIIMLIETISIYESINSRILQIDFISANKINNEQI